MTWLERNVLDVSDDGNSVTDRSIDDIIGNWNFFNRDLSTSLSGLLIRPKCYKFRFRGHDFASTSLLALLMNI